MNNTKLTNFIKNIFFSLGTATLLFTTFGESIAKAQTTRSSVSFSNGLPKILTLDIILTEFRDLDTAPGPGFFLVDPPLVSNFPIIGFEEVDFTIFIDDFTDIIVSLTDPENIGFSRPFESVDIEDTDNLIGETHLGFVSGNQGNLFLQDYTNGIISNIGIGNKFFVPALQSSDETDLYVGVDLNKWLASPIDFDIGDSFNFIDGLSNELGNAFVAGSSPIKFSLQQGWFTEQPFTGEANVFGKIDGDAQVVPETCLTLSLLTIGILGVGSMLTHKNKH